MAGRRSTHFSVVGVKRQLPDDVVYRYVKETALQVDRDRLVTPRPVLASLAAFVRAGLRPQSALARAIVVVLAVKLVAVTAMGVYFHFTGRHAAPDTAAVYRLIGPPSSP